MGRVVSLLLLAVLAPVFGASTAAAQASVETKVVSVRYQPPEEVTVPPVVDELAPEVVLTIEATGFESSTTGEVRQCVKGERKLCSNRLPVRFDGGGAAQFQYLVSNAVDPAADPGQGCRIGANRCTVELTSGSRTTVIDTVFIDAAPPLGDISVEPSAGLVDGDTVVVSASGFPAGTELTVIACAAPATSGPRCGAPGTEVPLIIDSGGTAAAEVTLDVAEVGSDGVACGRRTNCRLVVSSGQVGVRATPVTLRFADAPGADYTATAVVIGVAVAAGFLLLAAWVIRSTNWDPPAEADSSAIDEAEFADLDREAELFEERERVAAGS